jgi:anti-sigma regulatory factor (Ser/Thr protein kinase)
VRYSAPDIGYVPINPMKQDMGGFAAGEVIGVIDTEGDRAEWTFPAEPGAVRTARQAVRGRLRGWGLDSLADLTALLVSELVTNALRHATGPIGVRLVRPSELNGVLLVEVSDPLPDPPRERAARPEDESGRGLKLVASSCRRWGTRPGGVGKTVWFELAVPE